MELDEILQPKTILLNWQPSSKTEAVSQLVDALDHAGLLEDKGRVLEDVLDREASLSTGLGDGIAYPHARSVGVERVVMAFGIVREGLDFDSRDGEPAVFIPLMVSPREDGAPHLYVMAEIVKRLELQEVRKTILNADSPQEVYKILTG